MTGIMSTFNKDNEEIRCLENIGLFEKIFKTKKIVLSLPFFFSSKK